MADQDDIWLPGKIDRAVRSLVNSGAAGYSSAVTAFWSDGRERPLRQTTTATRSDFLFEGAGQGCTFVLTAAFFLEVRAFLAASESATRAVHYHDWTIYALARSWNKIWYFDTQLMMRYRQHKTNDTGARLSLNGVLKRLRLIKEGWYRRELETIARICSAAAPNDGLIAHWIQILVQPPSVRRQIEIITFFLRGGRRRSSDNFVLILSALLGWI